MSYHVYFPESMVALSEEISRTPDLVAQLKPNGDLQENLAIVATYLNIAVDGMYELDDLCEHLYVTLRAKNSPIILLNP